jgi:RNA polymerase sigma factor (TIGR02999 family)
MATSDAPGVQELLAKSRTGDSASESELMARLYDELRSLAAGYLRQERVDHTLQPTALVHEAYLRLVDKSGIDGRDRTHFFRTAAQVMRRVLVDHARGRRAAKRRGDRERITLDDAVTVTPDRQVDLLGLDEALGELARLNERHVRVVELRFFAGLTIEETARALDISTTTVEDDWAIARAWLRSRLAK